VCGFVNNPRPCQSPPPVMPAPPKFHEEADPNRFPNPSLCFGQEDPRYGYQLDMRRFGSPYTKPGIRGGPDTAGLAGQWTMVFLAGRYLFLIIRIRWRPCELR